MQNKTQWIALGAAFASVALALPASGQVTPAPDMAAINTALTAAQQLAGDDVSLRQIQSLQCHEPSADGTPTTTASFDETATVPPTKIFDNLYYIGDSGTGSFVVTTSDGYIMIDSGYGNGPETLILPGMKALGLDPALVKYILITHPGPDHLGGAKYFQDAYGTKIVMTASGWDGVLNAPEESFINSHLPGREPEKFWAGPPAMSEVAKDGDTLTLGDTTVTMVETPRVPQSGALSFILPVTDQGVPHMWATYGATGAPATQEGKMLYQQSVNHMLDVMADLKVDTIISNHPFVDGSVSRMAGLAAQETSDANPFVIGTDAAQRYVAILGKCAEVWVARNAAGLDDLGLPIVQAGTP